MADRAVILNFEGLISAMTHEFSIKNKIEDKREIKVAPFKKDIRKTSPHKHQDYFELIYLSKGSGTHFIDYNKFRIYPPVIFFVRKEQVHFWELRSEPQGYVVILKKSFIDRSPDPQLRSILSQFGGLSSLQVKDPGSIEPFFKLLNKESETAGEINFEVVEGLLKALLAKIRNVSTPYISKDSFKGDLYHSFIDLVNQEGELKNQVAYYAKKLHTTPQNLNSACRKAVSQSASSVLSDHILSEARRLLIYTDNTVSEIAFVLQFNDPSHFVKYFKRHTGHTPAAFRRM